MGYRWLKGRLVIDENEAPVRKLIYDLFLKHRRKKTVAKLLNDLGYRTRKGALFSDTTIDRILRDTTAKGYRGMAVGTIEVEPLISSEIWERANSILGGIKPAKQAAQLFVGMVYCGCSGKMIVPSSSAKYVCRKCRRKVPISDLEAILHSQLWSLAFAGDADLGGSWSQLGQKEKRLIVEQICERIVVERDTIRIEFAFAPHSFKALIDGQQNESGDETVKDEDAPVVPPSLNEPLLSEAAAAKFLGVSKMTLSRKRNAGEIGYFRLGFRVLYSKEKHLMLFLQQREAKQRSK